MGFVRITMTIDDDGDKQDVMGFMRLTTMTDDDGDDKT